MLCSASAFLIPAGACVIDEYPTHQTRRNSEKVCPILPSNLACISEADERFVDEGGRLEGVILPLPSHVAARETTKLRLYERHEPLECTLVAIAPGSKQVRHSCSVSRQGYSGCGMTHILRARQRLV
jgi:hypothetical protein